MFASHDYSFRKRNPTNYSDLHNGRKLDLHSKDDEPPFKKPMESETSNITKLQEGEKHFGENKVLTVKLVRIQIESENRHKLENPEEANNANEETKSGEKRDSEIETQVNAKIVIPERVDVVAIKKQGVCTGRLGRIPKKRVEEFDGAKMLTANRRAFSVGIMEAIADEMKPDRKRLLMKPRSSLEPPAKKVKAEVVKKAAAGIFNQVYQHIPPKEKLYLPKMVPELPNKQIFPVERKFPNNILNNSMTTEKSRGVERRHMLSQENSSPKEMDLKTKPILIPLENPDRPTYDFTSTPWPEPKGFTPLPSMSLDLSDVQSNFNDEPLPTFPLPEPNVSTPVPLMSLDLSHVQAKFNKPLPSYPPRSSWMCRTRGLAPAMPRVGNMQPCFQPRTLIPHTFRQLNSHNNQRHFIRGRDFRRGRCNNIY